MSTVHLLVRDEGKEPPRRVDAVDGLSIGRSPENQCVLVDPNAGRKAARLVEERGAFFVEDLGSTNRTAIRGGRKLGKGEREPLRNGMVLEIGRSSIEIVIERPPEEITRPETGTAFGAATLVDSGDRTMVGPAEVSDRTMQASDRTMQAPDRTMQAPDRTMQAPDRTMQAPDRTMQAPDRTVQAPRVVGSQDPTLPPPQGLSSAPRPVPTSIPVPVSPPMAPPLEPQAVTSAPPAPAPAAKPAPRAAVSASSTADIIDVGSGTQSIRPVSGDLGAIGELISRRPRLVVVNEAIRRAFPMQGKLVLIGRESGDCVIEHKAISQPHAAIRYVDALRSFQIEDRKSKNQTFVGSVALNPDTPQPLTPECLVRFGPIEAVFVVELDSDNNKIPPAWYAAAVRALLAQQQVTPEQVRAAEAEAAKGACHVGEALMLAGAIPARTWARAFEIGKLTPPDAGAKGGRRGLWIALGALALVALGAALWYFRAKLFS